MATYVLVLRCKTCGTRWKHKSKTKQPKRVSCPNLDCGKVQRDIGFDPAEGKAPAIGGSIVGKAIDYTADMVMKDYGLTDLKDNIREGEAMAPKLPIGQQRAADNFFNPAAAVKGPRSRQIQAMGRRALAGGYRNNALDVKGVMPDGRVKLRKVGTEQIQRPGAGQ